MYCKDGDFMRRKFKRRTSRRRVITILLVLMTIVSVITYIWMQPVITRSAVSVAETIMLNSANDAIVQILEGENVSYSDIVNLKNDSEGYVTSLEINVLEINNLKSRISNAISDIISERESYGFGVPLGSFFGNAYTNGFGPKIPFKMQITTTAFVDFEHTFKSAGINQVLHIVNVNIRINGSLVVAGYNKGINVSTSAIAAQTVIVGKTPEAFTNVIESSSDNTGALINDYGAGVE